jgi:hypothetical protein
MAKGEGARHTGCRRGTRVLVKFRDGREIQDIFQERTDKFIFLKEYGRVAKIEVRAFTAVKRQNCG